MNSYEKKTVKMINLLSLLVKLTKELVISYKNAT